MDVLLNPNVAYLFLVAGFLLAILAVFSPGTGILEIGALFTLVVAGYGIYNLPVNGWALLVLILGVFPFLIALRKSGRWIYLIVSVVTLVVGSVYLFKSDNGWQPAVHPLLAVVVSGASAGFLWLIARKGLEAVRLRPSFDPNALMGAVGETRTEVFQEGSVYVAGEMWSATSQTLIPARTRVRVIGQEGFILQVEEASRLS